MNALDRLPMRVRSPIPPYVRGWFCVADSDEVKQGEMKPVSFFGDQFVVYRTLDGVARVANAFCPHLGAHVASHDGKIENGEIVCPFHKWRFAGDTGLCTSVPYADAPAGKVGLKVYPTKELLGLVLMYFDPSGRPADGLPTYDTDEFKLSEWTKSADKSWVIYAHAQEFVENIFDPAHLTQLHPTTIMPVYETLEERDYGYYIRLGFSEGEQFPVESVEFNFAGLSYSYQVTKGTGFQVATIASFTPIDEERTLQRVRLYVKKSAHEAFDEIVGQQFSERFIFEVEQDLNVLNYKKHLPAPKLCVGDGPIYQYRRYAQKFYPVES